MALADTLRKLGDSSETIIGTASKGNDYEMGLIDGFYLLKRGTKIQKSADFGKTEIQALQLAGSLYVVKDVEEVTLNNSENQKTERTSGKKSVGRRGFYEYTIKTEGGEGLYKSLSSLIGNDRWDIVFIDDKGVAKFREYEEYIGGYKLNYLSPEQTNTKTGADSSSKDIMFQINDTEAFDQNGVFLKGEEEGVDFIEDIDPIVELDYDIKVVPSNADTTVVISTSSFINSNTDIAALLGTSNDVADVYVNDTAVAVSGIAKTGVNEITATIPALATGEKVKVKASPFAGDDYLFQAKFSAEKTVA